MNRMIALFMALILVPSAGWMAEEVKSRAYAGHENDRDVRNLVGRYPHVAGTRLDDCQTCHRSGIAGTDTEREYSPCGYCHILQYPNRKLKTGIPKNFEDTLNAFGLAYKQNGRSEKALDAIAALDSDGDSYSNEKEIADLRYPGEKASRPGQPFTPTISLSWEEIRKLPRHTQFMLMNTHSEQYDDYATYTGVRLIDVLKEAGISLEGATGITVFAPDGYSTDYTVDEVQGPYPRPYFYAAAKKITEKEKELVRYPDFVPEGIVDGRQSPLIPWLLLAFEKDGKVLDVAQYEKGTGRLTGEGPYRLVKPQKDVAGDPAMPGRPDRSVKSARYGDGWDYRETLDHNAGFCVRGAVAIRINPMPSGYEEFDWKNGWPLVGERRLVIFGKGVSRNRK